MRLPFNTIHAELKRVLLKYQLTEERADLCARLFTETSRDGVYSHGINRFPRFIDYIQRGFVDVNATPKMLKSFGNMEQWDGQLGPGNLNAWVCMERAIELAKTHGIGLLALRNTNHWMRGGTYGWQAADQGCIAICITNTIPNMPAWGAKEPTLGNNPLIMAVPRPEGNIVYDAAMTQFSFGKVEFYARAGKELPVVGGFDMDGNVTKDPVAIEASGRALPFGFWKGSGLSMMLDLLVATLSAGLSTIQIGEQNETEYGLSQLFIVIDPSKLTDQDYIHTVLDKTISALHQAEPTKPGAHATYPGERTLKTRQENNELGIPIDEGYWEMICKM